MQDETQTHDPPSWIGPCSEHICHLAIGPPLETIAPPLETLSRHLAEREDRDRFLGARSVQGEAENLQRQHQAKYGLQKSHQDDRSWTMGAARRACPHFRRQANHMKRQLRAWPTIPASQADFMAHCRRLKHKFECNKVQMQLATPPEVLNPRVLYKAQMRFELLNSQPQNHVESCSPDPESESESWSDCFDISPSW